jgi:hypothetical protein
MTSPSEVHVPSSCRFIDSFGFEWQAHEVAAVRSAPTRESHVLYFFSRGATRVLREYPADWAQLSWVELEDLCAQGRAVHRDGLIDLHPEFRARRSAV